MVNLHPLALLRQNKSTCAFLAVLALAGLAPLITLTSANSTWHTSGKSIERSKPLHDYPVRVLSVTAASKTVKFEEKFTGGDDWLRDATLTVKNVSGKPIVFLELDLNFPETKRTGYEMSFPLTLGQRPGVSSFQESTLKLNPEEVVTLRLDGERYDRLVRFIELRHPLAEIGTATLRVGFVAYADGTAWSDGTWYRVDQTNPNRYAPLKEFDPKRLAKEVQK